MRPITCKGGITGTDLPTVRGKKIKLSNPVREILLDCIAYHELHASEPINSLEALAKDFKNKKHLKQLILEAKTKHLKYVKTLKGILGVL